MSGFLKFLGIIVLIISVLAFLLSIPTLGFITGIAASFGGMVAFAMLYGFGRVIELLENISKAVCGNANQQTNSWVDSLIPVAEAPEPEAEQPAETEKKEEFDHYKEYKKQMERFNVGD